VCVRTCMYVCMYVCMLLHVYMCACMCVHVCVCMNVFELLRGPRLIHAECVHHIINDLPTDEEQLEQQNLLPPDSKLSKHDHAFQVSRPVDTQSQYQYQAQQPL